MKCRFLIDTPGHVPGDPSQPLTRRVGEELEHPDCWRLCLPNGLGRVLCEPADEECHAAVTAWKQRNRKAP